MITIAFADLSMFWIPGDIFKPSSIAYQHVLSLFSSNTERNRKIMKGEKKHHGTVSG